MSVESDIESTGQMPRFAVEISKLMPEGLGLFQLFGQEIDTFINYSFDSSILIPVDSFSFTFAMPGRTSSLSQTMREGDIAILKANGEQIAKGIIDTIEVETDEKGGETITVSGRDMLGQLEDQDSISALNAPINVGGLTGQDGRSGIPLSTAIGLILGNTRIEIEDVVYSNLPQVAAQLQLLASEVGEKKMATLQRLLEPLNCLAWMNSQGKLVIGQPTMTPPLAGFISGTIPSKLNPNVIICSKEKSYSNVQNIRAIRSAAQIPNSVLPIWVGQGLVQQQIQANQIMYNPAPGPDRLRRLKHFVPSTVTVSNPNAGNSDGLVAVNVLQQNANLLSYYAKREIARRNVDELIVQCTIQGHVNEFSGLPFQTDTIYHVDYEAHDVSENMYLFHVQYYMDASQGAFTRLYFTRLGTIVGDAVAVPGYDSSGNPTNSVGFS